MVTVATYVRGEVNNGYESVGLNDLSAYDIAQYSMMITVDVL